MRGFRYWLDNGRCAGIFTYSDDGLQVPQLNPGQWYHVISPGNPNAEAIDHSWFKNLSTGLLERKPQMTLIVDKVGIIADGVDTATILRPIKEPNGTFIDMSVSINDQPKRYTLSAGSFEFSTLDPGAYRITFRGINYLPATIEITAHEIPTP